MKRTAAKVTGEVSKAINELSEIWFPHTRIITSNNGKKFACHKEFAKVMQIDFYFANPSCSAERSVNKNINRLVRQYFPTKTSCPNITDKQV